MIFDERDNLKNSSLNMRAQMCAQIGRVADQGGCTRTHTENTNGAHMKHKENTQKHTVKRKSSAGTRAQMFVQMLAGLS